MVQPIEERAGGKMVGLWNGMLYAEIFQRDHKETDTEGCQGILSACWLWEKYQ